MSLASVKSRLVLPIWYRLTRVVPDKGPLNSGVCISSLHIFYSPKFLVQTRSITVIKLSKKEKQVTINIPRDNETAYLTDYTAIQRVSLNKFVFTHGHSVINVTDSTQLIQSEAILEVLTLKIFLAHDTTT